MRIRGQNYRGVVTDLSARGLFIQTKTVADEDTEVQVRLYDVDSDPIDLIARVARRRTSHRSLAALEMGGLGLRVVSAPEAYFELLLSVRKPNSD